MNKKLKKPITLDGFLAMRTDKQINQLPERLVQQASAIAQKVIRELIYKETSR